MTNNRRALVVDDIPANRLIAEAMLKQLGWSVLLAEDGLEALQVWIDPAGPGVAGYQYARHEWHGSVP